jgi:hypothetical protein
MSKNINQQPPIQHYRYYFIAAAVATAIFMEKTEGWAVNHDFKTSNI